jgi:aminoglycoside phosphotransferase family enzyme
MNETGAGDRPPAPGLARLREAFAGTHPRETLITIDTGAAQVLLAGGHAIKLRRPLPCLADAPGRRAALERELACNASASPTVYAAVVPIPAPAACPVPMAGWPRAAEGEVPVDWAMVMRRLPRARMLDRAIHNGRVGLAEIDRVASRLVRLYEAARRPQVQSERVLARIDREQRHNRAGLPHLAALLDRCDQVWRAQRDAVRMRIEQGEIVDAHGDLRPEHVCLTEPIELIDRLEFDSTLRLLDPWEEIGLLGMFCAMAGAAWVGPRLADRIEQATSRPRPPAPLLAFYCAHHALIRARLAFAHLRARPARRVRHWRDVTRRYGGYAEAALSGWTSLAGGWAGKAGHGDALAGSISRPASAGAALATVNRSRSR